MSNRAQVIIRGHRHPIIGRICMDQTLVNLGPILPPAIGMR
jgi:alanine racemase